MAYKKECVPQVDKESIQEADSPRVNKRKQNTTSQWVVTLLPLHGKAKQSSEIIWQPTEENILVQ